MGNHNRVFRGSGGGFVNRHRNDSPDETGVRTDSGNDAVDEGYDPPDTYDDYGDWKEDYADAVGISRWREL